MPTDVTLYGWGVGDEVTLLSLPAPAYPSPLTLTTLRVPALNEMLRTLRPDQDIAYPEERGELHRDERGTPHTLRLLGREWVVLAQLDHGPAMEVDATLNGPNFQRATSAAFDALEAHTHD